MKHQIFITNWGTASSGKSASIRYAFELLRDRYPSTTTVLLPTTGYNPTGDVKAVVEIFTPCGKSVKVGIESYGDTADRVKESINDFIARGCDIILNACHTSGNTMKAILAMQPSGWQVIWMSNARMKMGRLNIANPVSHQAPLTNADKLLQDKFNRDYAHYAVALIERLVLNDGVI